MNWSKTYMEIKQEILNYNIFETANQGQAYQNDKRLLRI